MSQSQTLDAALRRLEISLDVLEAAVARRKAGDDVVAQLEEDVHLLAVDRSRLADTCDHLKAQTAVLTRANIAASHRVEHAVAALRDVLGEDNISFAASGGA